MSKTREALGQALMFQRGGKLQQAEQACHQILQVEPQNVNALHLGGLIAHQLGRSDRAVDYISQAVRLAPHFAEAHNNLGIVLAAQGKLDEAVASFQRGLRIKPNDAETHNNMGIALKEQGNLAEAVGSFQQALNLKPDFAEAHNNLGTALAALGRLEDAVASYQRALLMMPDYAEAHNNLGAAFKEQGKLEAAVASYQKALRLKPDYVEAHNNLGVAFKDQGKLEAAVASYQQALRLKPDHAGTHNNLGIACLLMGDFERGWAEYEWRAKVEGFLRPSFPQPLWDGSRQEGRTILLYMDQGSGDALQAIRYAPLVKERVGQVLVWCTESLVRLLTGCSGIDRLIVGSDLPPFDVHAPLLGVPGILGTTLATIPATVPYLHADAERSEYWRAELGKRPTFKIGIAWQGAPTHKNDRNRSFPLSHFAPVAGIEGVQLLSLQTGAGTEQLATTASRFPVTELGSKLNDFMETAAVVDNLDLIITADTALAHLAGALGAKVWVALPFAPDWRWLLDRDDSPWYPTMRLFRQTQPGNWDEVFARITDELKKLRAS